MVLIRFALPHILFTLNVYVQVPGDSVVCACSNESNGHMLLVNFLPFFVFFFYFLFGSTELNFCVEMIKKLKKNLILLFCC